MLKVLKRFFKEEDGLGTVEIVILIAVLVAVALIFGRSIKGVVTRMLTTVETDATDALSEMGA